LDIFSRILDAQEIGADRVKKIDQFRYKSCGLTHGFVFDICTVILADYSRFPYFAVRLKAVHNSFFSFHLLS